MRISNSDKEAGSPRRKNTFFRSFAFLSLALPLSFFCSAAHAAITPTINYQGFLLSKLTNMPVETPQDIKFVLYNAATGGAPLFAESRCDVPVNKGRYDVEIGSATSGGIPVSLFTDYSGLWLEIQLDANGDCSGVYEAMSPRVRLQASPYAFNSLYASTSSAATTVFSADTIGALAQTTNGAITISTNLFVQGGISVGSISPGQKLAVAGIVESSTGGFKFPDGSVQIKAAALTMWDVSGPNLFTINPGNIGIGENITSPLARLHISSAAGDTGDLLLVTTGTALSGYSQLFLVNGNGQVYGGSFYGDGSTLGGIVRKAGDTMTGQLTMAASSVTVTSGLGLGTPKLKLLDNVEISSASAAVYGGIRVSTHIYLSPGAKYYGDGSGLTSVVSLDSTKVLKAGDSMTGPLTLQNSTLTVTGSAFSVAGTTFSVLNGNTAVGSSSYQARLTVGGGIIASSSITAQGGLFAPSVNASAGGNFYNVTAASGTFWAFGQYSVETSSSIKVNDGYVDAPYFKGNGAMLTNVSGTDSSRVLKAGDTVTGNLVISGSSLTVASYGSQPYALTVASAPAVNAYTLAVTTAGNVGVQVSDPSAPLEVNGKVLVSNSGGSAEMRVNSFAGYSYISWGDSSLVTNGPNQGVLGYPLLSRDLVYRSMGTDPSTGGSEVFRIKSDDNANWRFGIGTNSPLEKFHVASNMLVSTSAVNPILYISTAAGMVSIGTTTQTSELTVNGGINAVSSITAQGGFFGNGSGITSLSASSLPQVIAVGSITAVSGAAYDGVVFSTVIYATARLAVGPNPIAPTAELHVHGTIRLDQNGGPSVLYFMPDFPTDSYIRWDDPIGANQFKGVLGTKANSRDLIYHAGASTLDNGSEAFRIKPDGTFIMGSVSDTLNFLPASRFRVITNMSVAAEGSTSVLFVSTGTGSVGISTGTPQERMHVASSFLVGASRAAAALYVSTQTGYTGVGTGAPQSLLDVNGPGVFRSSLTVTGTGLTGTQTAMAVLGSTLVVRNDGTVGIGAAFPQARLDVNGSAQFGSGVNKSTFTAEGYWQPRSMTSAQMQALSPVVAGAVVFNSSIMDLCVSTGTAVGQWALAGSKGAGNCF